MITRMKFSDAHAPQTCRPQHAAFAITTSQFIAACLLSTLLSACGGGGGGGGDSSAGPAPQPANVTDPNTYSSAPTASLTTPNENVAVTRSSITLNGTLLNYTATAGHLTAKTLGSGADQASMFYVAYTLDGANPATRPITYFFNGGPGSASLWLHLGSFGPKRLVTGIPATTATTPFPLVDNAESMLDISDLVFIDAVGSGFSQAIAPFNNQSFWSVDADANVFRDFIMRHALGFNRTASPKFIFGESYGGPRAAVLALALESAGTRLVGVILQAPALDCNSNCGIISSPPLNCAPILPTYSAVGAWHNLAQPSPAAAQLPAHLETIRTLATTQYAPAVNAFLAGANPPPELIPQLVSATGLSQTSWLARFNMNPGFVQSNLLAGQLLGRYDARMSVASGSALARDGDPSSTFIGAGFANGISSHLATLQFSTRSGYVTSSGAIDFWNFTHAGRPLPDTIPDLAAALALNPRLRVLSMSGYHDLATPFNVTERDLARINSSNISVRNYMGGHMTYLDSGSRVLQKADLAQFYQATLSTQ